MLQRSRIAAGSVIGFVLFTAAGYAQQSRISGRISTARTVVLPHHVPARARRALDQGPVAASFPLTSVTMYLQTSPNQEASLKQLLANQKNPGSAGYHKWLTPEQYGDQFGVSASDVSRMTAWLESQGLHVDHVARSRTFIRFSGTAEQVENALDTQIDQFLENGQVHYANVSDPSVPEALSGIVRGFGGLHNFRLKPRSVLRRAGGEFTNSFGQNRLVPDDFATIYDVAPLYAAGIDGTGQKMVVVGQTEIKLTDIQLFRSKFGLPANDPQLVLVPRTQNPGISPDDLPEADLDVEWSGAVARNAQIIYVYSDNVNTSLTDAIDQAYAPVISMSYGLCEGNDLVDLPTYQAQALQANAEGITWLNASGDSGAGDCEDIDALVAQDGPTVDAPSSVPEVTGMGGTEFVEGSGSYWSDVNTATGGSALSYIPEKVWNDTPLGFGFSAGGGGTSVFFPKPIWQTGPGVPSNGFRNVPDVSIASSADHDGYSVYTSGKLQVYGGTSLAAPTMAGIVTLLNQYLVSSGAQAQPGLANINPQLYRLAQNAPGVFHDVTMGDNSLPCVSRSPGCVNGFFGFSAGPNYDRASGLGSPDAFNLVHAWSSQAATGATVVGAIDQNPVFQQGNNWPFALTLSEESGVAATVTSLTINGAPYNVNTVFATGSIPAHGSISSNGFALANLVVPTNVVFEYSGTDALGHPWSGQLTIPFSGPQTRLVIGGVSNAATGQQSYAPGMLVSVYGTALGGLAQSAGTIPLPQFLAGFEAWVNGVTAPLYYVSPNQVNLQIPYETQPGRATLTVGNPYVNVDYHLTIVAAAPGIFTSNGFVFPPFASAGRGKETALYITGEGQVTPALSDGDAPSSSTPRASLPKPRLPVTVTVANKTAATTFIGHTPGTVGVTQINYVVPDDAPLGAQDVVVTVGTVASPPAKLTVTQ